ncbi:hypothetical protein [Agrobacterium tumefaciens]|uniref:hypothetical protein n=1 Tax=Agrobacterium tumefaciens TaxID=358 RepID=UPI00045A5E33|nr:hypothetical protein [Agrobacterium tumefaciens]CDN91359.1 hypothetical protein BN949_00493 [Agrobacterium tumefaciens]
MRDFSKVSPKIWRNRDFRALPSPGSRLLFLYLMTSEHQNSAGCFRLPEGYAVYDLGCTSDEYAERLQEIEASGLVLIDYQTSEIFIRGWFDMNAAMNDRHALRITKAIADIESATLRETVQTAFYTADANRKPDKVKAARAKMIEAIERTANTSSLSQTGYMQRRAPQ